MSDRARAAAPFPASAPPAGALRRRFRAWWQARLTRTDTLLLTQRNVYILPTRAGFVYAATLLVLLIASINYQLNLGYLLTFLLGGSAVASMHMTHATLRGLTLHLRPPCAVHAGECALLDVVLASPGAARWGIGVGVGVDSAAADLSWTDVPALGEALVQAGWTPPRRGLHELPLLRVETRFPLGLFRAWAVWRPASTLLAYPAPEKPPMPLPASLGSPRDDAAASRRADGAEFDGVRGYRRGDPLKHVVWKKAATALATGGELISRDHAATAAAQLSLDWQACAGLEPEARLARLAAWVHAAHRAGLAWRLALPGVEMPFGDGDAQRRASLEALALWH